VSAPTEVWFRQNKNGWWEWSFDPPVKRYELKFTRLVLATPLTEAAPALLEACEASVARCKLECTPQSHCGQCEPLLAAIAKARGGQ
jgi:hypothetical protein